MSVFALFFFFQAEDGIRDLIVTGVQTCALPISLREVLPALRHPEVLRYFVLSSHYRGPINYSLDQLEQADAALGRIYTALRDVPAAAAVRTEYSTRFHEVMDDDFNTPEALAVLQTLTREVNSAKAAGEQARAVQRAAELRSLAG